MCWFKLVTQARSHDHKLTASSSPYSLYQLPTAKYAFPSFHLHSHHRSNCQLRVNDAKVARKNVSELRLPMRGINTSPTLVSYSWSARVAALKLHSAQSIIHMRRGAEALWSRFPARTEFFISHRAEMIAILPETKDNNLTKWMGLEAQRVVYKVQDFC